MAYSALPDEILAIICQALGSDRDFGSLYNCALGAKSLADPALRILYQYHELSPAFIQSEEDQMRRRSANFRATVIQQQEFFRRWTVLWRSIILSSQAKTYKPYCRYLRILDFRNLGNMFEDNKFAGLVKEDFFAQPLPQLGRYRQAARMTVSIIQALINDIGEMIISKAGMLEEICGHLSPDYLTKWISRSPRLKNMVLFEGKALASGAGTAIANHCEDFNSLTVHLWSTPDADSICSTFLNELKTDTVKYFEAISINKLGRLSFEALGRHKSLKELKLGSLSTEAIRSLPALRECTQIRTLLLERVPTNVSVDYMEQIPDDIVRQAAGWLSSCRNLEDVTIKFFSTSLQLLMPVLQDPDIRLTRLSLEGFNVASYGRDLHEELSRNPSLEILNLNGSGFECPEEDLDFMVESFCKLPSLKELVLKDWADRSLAKHIIELATGLPELEEFWTGGQTVGEEILPPLANLKHLKSLTLCALTQFSYSAILNFIEHLNPETQRGFNFSLMTADITSNLDERELKTIRDAIRKRVDGQFEFVLWRDADSSDSEDEDDD